MKDLRLTQTTLGQRIGCSPSAVSRAFAGEIPPLLIRIATYLDTLERRKARRQTALN